MKTMDSGSVWTVLISQGSPASAGGSPRIFASSISRVVSAWLTPFFSRRERVIGKEPFIVSIQIIEIAPASSVDRQRMSPVKKIEFVGKLESQ